MVESQTIKKKDKQTLKALTFKVDKSDVFTASQPVADQQCDAAKFDMDLESSKYRDNITDSDIF